MPPLVQDSKLSFEKDFFHCLASNFSARRSQQRARLNQCYVEELQVVLFGHPASNILDDLWQVVASIISGDFVYNDQTFITFDLCREHYAFTRPQSTIALAESVLDVFRITVTSADYDQ